jgi:7-alpha-hydroxysteroid dehydrogenase
VILDRFRLDGQSAVVTGAGRGIGAASAIALAQCGADVVLAARTESQLDDVAHQIEALGRRALTVACDLMDLTAVGALAERAHDEFNRLDVVVNNVGGTIPLPLLDTTPEYLEEAFHFNVATAHALVLTAVPFMLRGDGGSIVNISSVMGRISGRGFSAYGTAKAAMAHYTRLAAKDLAPRIRMNAIAAGSTATSALEIVTQTPELKDEMERSTPLRRIGDVEDISAAVIYLASRAGAYMTGKILEVDGGIDVPNLDFNLADL